MNIRQCFAKDTSKAIEICGKLNETFIHESYYVDKIASLKHELFILAKKHHLHIHWCGDDAAPTGNKFIISKGKREVCTFYYLRRQSK